jgi:DNA polymerase-3 subunit alpha
MEPLTFKNRDFVHLHLHSDYSLLQSTIQLKPLAARLNELEMKACAITDYGNMYGSLSFYKTMKKSGIRPIIGYEAFVTSGSRSDRSSSVAAGERPYYNLVLLAKNLVGYHNLVQLASRAFTEGFHHKPRIDMELLPQFSNGLIGLSGGRDGSLNHFLRQDDRDRALVNANELASLFGKDNFFIEIQDHWSADEPEMNAQLAAIATESGVGLVATNNAHYLTTEDSVARQILLCIADGRTLTESEKANAVGGKLYVRSAEEMWEVFGDTYPEALTNTTKIAEMCELDLEISGNNLILPNFPIPETSGARTGDEYFEKIVREGLEKLKETVLVPMIEAGTLKYPLEDYDKRLDLEIGVIERMGYSGYFLIVWDFIKYAVEKGIPVGPGRGSAAGSLVAYALGITGIDPLQYDLFFERFLNPERISMPDIDIDFCIRGRGDVISHVSDLYGRQSVCQIATFGTMASRAAIKDVGRALNMPYGEVEKIAKLIPPPFRGRNISISESLERVAELKAEFENNPRVKELIDLALRVEGCSRHTSVHAAGVVISPKPLHEIIPVAVTAKNEFTSQYPMGDLEAAGMLKMDFLGLTTLTIIADCLASIKEKESVEIDWTTIPLNDGKTMQLFSEGKTDAIFQFESSGMQDICRRLKPKELEDLSALNALYRPGPLDGGMVEEFILRHRGTKQVEYIVPEMEDILKNTFGVLVYQEQIMQIAQKLAGYSLGEADMMRRAMGKKKKEEMDPHEVKFIGGAIERGIARKTAKEIFDLMAKFADYGFNRSHSIAYAYLAFQTGYLKAHYPAFFYSAVLSHEADDSAKVYKYSNELRSMGLSLLPPDVNESDEGFTPAKGSVRFGLSAIKGMGAASAKAIIDARASGPFTSLFDFATRVEQGAVNKRSLESLITAGAFDTLNREGQPDNLWRARLFAAIDSAIQSGQSAWNDRSRGQSGLFGDSSAAAMESDAEMPDAKPWSAAEISAKEKAAIGFYLSAHPLDEYADTLKSLRIRNVADHGDIQPGSNLVVAGIVSALQVRWSKKGNRFATYRIEDQSTGIKCVMWADAYGKYAALLENDALLIVEGKVESGEGQETTLIVNDVRSLKEEVTRNARSVLITVPADISKDQYLDDIYAILNDSPGHCEVYVDMKFDRGRVRLQSQSLRIQGSRKVESELANKGCTIEWTL